MDDRTLEIFRRAMLRYNSIDFESVRIAMDTMSRVNIESINRSFDLANGHIESMQKALDRFNSINIDMEELSNKFYSIIQNIDFDSLSERYIKFTELDSRLNHILNEYQWFVLPEMPLDFIFDVVESSKMPNSREKINHLFFDYFSGNDFENLKELVEKWDSSGKLKPGRLKIIKDCLKAVLVAENGHVPSTLIVPTLVAQIDGIQREILLKNAFEITRGRFQYNGDVSSMNQNDAWNHIYHPNDLFSLMINDAILDILFANAMPGEPIKTPITFSRHKIMHGEHLNYGTKSNTIRTFIIIDFLHNLL